jgi:hypothetical protein
MSRPLYESQSDRGNEQANVTPDELRKLLRYEPETGKLFWKERTPDMFGDSKQTAEHKCSRWNSRLAGKEAFNGINIEGYKRGLIWSRQYIAHRIAWAVHHGSWPEQQIDHINGVKTDNRMCNLRDVSATENGRNRTLQANSTSGVTGVNWNKGARKWRACIRVQQKYVYLGHYRAIDDAIAARKAAEIEHGFHPNHGRSK